MRHARSVNGCGARLVREVGDRVWNGGEIAFDEALALLEDNAADPYELLFHANRLRVAHSGHRAHLCSIVNAKAGGCPENCGFCAQSARHRTTAPHYDLIPKADILEAGRRAAAWGSSHLGVVTATRGINEGHEDFERLLDSLRALAEDGRVEPHASLGMLGPEEFRLLKAAGVTMYNHNLETGRGFFSKVCTTHRYEDRVRTIRLAREAGLKLCVGGIIGMGEEALHRVELAFALKELDVDEVPINFLIPIEGTACQERKPLRPVEMLRALAVFRLVLPRKNIFVCAGRHFLGDLVSMIFLAGASGMMIGDFLTTKNRRIEDDLRLIADLGLEIARPRTNGTGARRLDS